MKVRSPQARPTDRLPIIRRDDEGNLLPELRRWGLTKRVDGKTNDKATGKPKKLAKPVINAMSEELTTSFTWKWSFSERRCLVPMSGWDE